MENTTYFSSWGQAMVASFQNAWFELAAFLPRLLAALVVLVIGLLIAQGLARVVRALFDRTRADERVDRIGLRDDLERVGVRGSVGTVIGGVVRWFVIAVTALAVVDVLQIPSLSAFVASIILYIPQVIVAAVILAVGLVLGRLVANLIRQASERSGFLIGSIAPVAAVAKWAIVVFALMAALVQLGIAASLVQILFTGLVVMLTIAGGLAFGLGGRDKAHDLIDRIDSEMRRNTGGVR